MNPFTPLVLNENATSEEIRATITAILHLHQCVLADFTIQQAIRPDISNLLEKIDYALDLLSEIEANEPILLAHKREHNKVLCSLEKEELIETNKELLSLHLKLEDTFHSLSFTTDDSDEDVVCLFSTQNMTSYSPELSKSEFSEKCLQLKKRLLFLDLASCKILEWTNIDPMVGTYNIINFRDIIYIEAIIGKFNKYLQIREDFKKYFEEQILNQSINYC